VLSKALIVIVLGAACLLSTGGLGDIIMNFSFLSMGLRGAVIFVPMTFALFAKGRVAWPWALASVIAGPLAVIAGNVAGVPFDPLFIGIGVNLGPCEFSEEVQQVATSVPLAGHHTRNEFAARVVRELAQSVSSAAEIERMMQEYRRLSIVLGREVRFETHEGAMAAEAVDIDDEGGLVVRTEDGKLTTLNGGEISVRF
jgi:hypothetical protein